MAVDNYVERDRLVALLKIWSKISGTAKFSDYRDAEVV